MKVHGRIRSGRNQVTVSTCGRIRRSCVPENVNLTHDHELFTTSAPPLRQDHIFLKMLLVSRAPSRGSSDSTASVAFGTGPNARQRFQRYSLFPHADRCCRICCSVSKTGELSGLTHPIRLFGVAPAAARPRKGGGELLTRWDFRPPASNKSGPLSGGMHPTPVHCAVRCFSSRKVRCWNEPFGALDLGESPPLHTLIVKLWNMNKMTISW